VRRSNIDSLNPLNLTPYAQDWLSFFTNYELPVSITPQPVFHLPPFPLARAIAPDDPLDSWLPPEIQKRAAEKKWNQVCLLLREEVKQQPKESLKERLVLAYAEGLLRMGEYRSPYFLLQRIAIQYPDGIMAKIAQFLLLYQRATRGDHIDTYYELLPFAEKFTRQTPFADDIHMLQAELALLTHQNETAEKLLADPILSQNKRLKELRLLRLADLAYAQGEKDKALTRYAPLAQSSPLLASDAMSLAAFCDCLYAAQRYQEGAQWYMKLGDLLNNEPQQDLALFRQAMCQLHMKLTRQKALLNLEQLIDAFPRSEGGFRALLKKTDLAYKERRLDPFAANAVYQRCTAYAHTLFQRETCLFKEALVDHLSGEQESSVEKCMKLLREFQGGKLRTEAMALIIQQLPGVVRQLVDDQEYVKGLVLAKQNRKYFVRGWLSADLLYDLGKAYSRLGLADQAAQTYQYLFEVADNADKEKIYLPLIEALFSDGRYLQVEEYADRYQLRYPNGAYQKAIFLFKAQALYRSGHTEKALELIMESNAPQMPALELLKARVYYANKEWQKVIDTLDTPQLQGRLGPERLLLPLAESYYQLQNLEAAKQQYQRLLTLDNQSEQARFRLAQIESRTGKSESALKMFQSLAEEGKDPLWKRMAREEAAILEMQL